MITLQQRVHSTPPPPNWSTNKLHRVLRVRKANKNTGMIEDNLLSLSYGRIVPKSIDAAEGLLPESFETYQIVEPGNIVMRLTDLQNDKRSLRQGLVQERGIITSAYDALEVHRDHDPRYWAYALLALDLAKYYYSLGGGVRQSIKFADFPNDWVAAPDLETQKAIANFLDRESARIDQLIEKKQRLVAICSEWRDVQLSALLLGHRGRKAAIPDDHQQFSSEWPVMKLGYCLDLLFDGVHVTPTYVDEGVPFLRVTDITSAGPVDWNSVRRISQAEFTEITRHRSAQKGDLLLSKNGTVGVPKVVTWDDEFAFFVSLAVLRPNKRVIVEFLEVYFRSSLLREQISDQSRQTSVVNLHLERIRHLKIPVPPIADQRRLVVKAKELCEPIEGLVSTIEISMDRLRELRAALITAAVTGQIDVTTWHKRGNTDHRLDQIEADFELPKSEVAE